MKSNSNSNNTQKSPATMAMAMAMEDHHQIGKEFQGNDVVQQWKYIPLPLPSSPTVLTACDPRDIIAQYYELEQRHCPTRTGRANFKHIETALPRHYAIVAASRQPRQFYSLTQLQLQHSVSPQIQDRIQSKSRARIHTLGDITPFTSITVRQKGVVIAHSGIAHLLVKKLVGVLFGANHPHTTTTTRHRVALERADIIASFISSALACEYLVGNRYYRNLPTILATERNVVGGAENSTYSRLTAEEATPAKIQETEEALQVLYDANIDRLESCVAQYERGFVSLETLRTDPEFDLMMSHFWKLNFQTMKWRSMSEDRIAAARANKSVVYSHDKETAERIFACSQIFKSQSRFARLCQYRIAHLFDNGNFNYASLLRTTKSSQLRLCNDGMLTALLAFAAIEPRMVTAEMVPKLGLTYFTANVSSAANHIQSRDPIFGELLAKHRRHIPLANKLYTKKAGLGDSGGIWRDSSSASAKITYVPVQDTLESIRTGRPCWPEKKEQQQPKSQQKKGSK